MVSRAQLRPGPAARRVVLALALALVGVGGCSSADRSGAAASSASSAGLGGVGDPDPSDPTGDPTGDPAGEGETDGASDGDADPPLYDVAPDPLAACDPWAQDCPAGSKCGWEQVAGLAKTRCVPLADAPQPPGAACEVYGDPSSGYDDCALGAACVFVDEANVGLCVALCEGSPASPSCADPSAQCQPCADCPSLCWPLCDPLGQDCAPGFACASAAGSFTCRPIAELGDGRLADACELGSQCGPGLACLDGASVAGCQDPGCCTPYCDLGAPACPSGMVCAPWFADPRPPLPELGVCQVP